MIPWRGLRLSNQTIGIGRRRIQPVTARQFSSTPVQHRTHGFLSKNRASIPGTAYNALRFSQTNTLLRNSTSIRFASTNPAFLPSEAASPAATATPSEFASEVSSDFSSSLDSATDFTSESLYNVPEHIGYLHELGLDYGWGPTSVMQHIIEHIHVYAGTPWWVTISLTAIVMRLALFKAYMGAADNGAIMLAIMPITKPLMAKMNEAKMAGDHTTMMQIRAELQQIKRRAGIKLWKSAVPMAQLFVGYGTFVVLRAMAKIPVPGLETGGFLWIYDLSVPDPFLVLPIATSAVLHYVLRKGGETGAMNLSPEMTRAMIWGLPTISALFTWWLPSAVQISFFVSGVLSLMQAMLFRSARFRNYFQMTPLPARPNPDAPKPSPYRGDLKIAARPSVLSQSQLNSRFQGAEVKNGEKEGQKKCILEGAKSEIKDVVSVIKTKARETITANEEKSRAKREARDCQAYELKRQAEIKQAKEDEQIMRLEQKRTKAKAKLAAKRLRK